MRGLVALACLAACGRVGFDAAPDAGPPIDVTLDLVSRWQFDETSGTTISDPVGNVTGTLVNGPMWRPAGGVRGGALDFDGVDDWVDFGASRIALPGAMTACAWIFLRRIPTLAESMIVRSCSVTTCQYSLEIEQEAAAALYWTYDGLGGYAITAPGSVTTDGWLMVCATREDGTTATVYFDGVAQPTTVVPAAIGTVPAPIEIGTGATFFDGLMDEVRLYDRPLSAREIEQMYRFAVGG